jgi:hypothetical protein
MENIQSGDSVADRRRRRTEHNWFSKGLIQIEPLRVSYPVPDIIHKSVHLLCQRLPSIIHVQGQDREERRGGRREERRGA